MTQAPFLGLTFTLVFATAGHAQVASPWDQEPEACLAPQPADACFDALEKAYSGGGALGLESQVEARADGAALARVESVRGGGSAALAGVAAGDVIMAINGKSADLTLDDGVFFAEFFRDLEVGQSVELTLQRGEQRLVLSVAAGPRTPGEAAMWVKGHLRLVYQRGDLVGPYREWRSRVSKEGSPAGS